MATTTIGVKIDEAIRDRLKALATAKDRTPHWIMKTALAEYLAREEAVVAQRREDEARWERYQLTGEAVAHEDVRDWLRALAEGKKAPCPR